MVSFWPGDFRFLCLSCCALPYLYMIPRETIDQIIETAQIDEIVGDFVTLKKRGANMLGLCPFHDEKTPSFTVSPAKGIYKCFGCGEGGNSLNFIMAHEHYSYPEALRYLAKRYSIDVPEVEMTPEMEAEQSERESQYVVMAYAENYFADQLWESDSGKAIGLSYFKERGFTEEVIRKFRLGYSPEAWETFTKSALENGYKKEFLVKTGLSKDKNDKLYDGYRGRVIFPIHNLSGRPIGFGGRTLKTDKKIPKYINTPECEIYNKRKVLYGLYFAKKSIVSEDTCLLVEGYTDVISMHQAGIENVVASSGTSLTLDQIRLISRYTQNITILFDGDKAGIKASFRGIDLILEQGLNVRVVMFPDGEDPDSFVRSHSSVEATDFIASNAKDFIVFKTDLLYAETAGDPIKKAALVHEIVDSIALIPDEIKRSLYIRECSNLVEIPEKALLSELNKARRKLLNKKDRRDSNNQAPPSAPEPQPGQRPSDGPPPPFPGDGPPPDLPPDFGSLEEESSKEQNDCTFQERDLVRLLLQYCHHTFKLEQPSEDPKAKPEVVELTVIDFILGELEHDKIKLENTLFQKVVDELDTLYEERDDLNAEKYFLNHMDPDISKACVDLMSSKYELHDWESKGIFVDLEDKKIKKAVLGSVYAYKAKMVGRMIEENDKALKEAFVEQKEFSEIEELIKVKVRLGDIKSELAKPTGRVILR